MDGNTVTLVGNLTRDIEFRTTPSGSCRANFGICWNRRRKDQSGNYYDDPSFFDVECWVTDAQRNVMEKYCLKGAKALITEAHLEQRSWERDGQRHSKVTIELDSPIGGLTVVNAPKR